MSNYYIYYNTSISHINYTDELIIAISKNKDITYIDSNVMKILNPLNINSSQHDGLIIGIIRDITHLEEFNDKIGKGRITIVPCPINNCEYMISHIWISTVNEANTLCEEFNDKIDLLFVHINLSPFREGFSEGLENEPLVATNISKKINRCVIL